MKNYLKNVRETNPLIQNITNYVTVNDVANVLLATGASPIMADEAEEMESMTTICSGLNINIGTLNKRTVESMFIAGKNSNKLGHITVLDPVGAGAGKYRTDTAKKLIKDVKFDAIKGNISEIKALFMGTDTTSGVDANVSDIVTEDNLDSAIAFVKEVANKMHTVIAITGGIDLISDGERTILIRNGRPEMKSITGIGCMLSGLIGAFIAANPDRKLESTAWAVMMMGVAGELAFKRLAEGDGNIAYRGKIIDAIYNMTDEIIEKEGNYEIR